MRRRRAGPQAFRKGFRGVLQTDAYAGYDSVIVEGILHAGCWAPARRKFHDAWKLDPGAADAAAGLRHIGRLDDVERQARDQQFDAPGRLRLRQEHSAAAVQALQERLLRIRPAVLPGSQLARACDYALRIGPRREVFLANGQVELDTNLAENAMRPVALGWRNWRHIGDAKAGPKIAAILSVLATCERLGIAARAYLLDGLPRLGSTPTGQVAQRTPQAGHRARQEKPAAPPPAA